jgi:hypothetical protein
MNEWAERKSWDVDKDDASTEERIVMPAANHFGLDPQEAILALRYAAASKDATRRAVTATPEQIERLKGMKRLRSLALDHYQRLKAIVLLPSVLEDERQCHMADQLIGTCLEMRKLEIQLGVPLTPKNPLFSYANRRRTAFRRADPTLKRTPTRPLPAEMEAEPASQPLA